MDLLGPDFSNYMDPISSDSSGPMTIFDDSREPIFNSRDLNLVPKTPLKILLQCRLVYNSPLFEGEPMKLLFNQYKCCKTDETPIFMFCCQVGLSLFLIATLICLVWSQPKNI